MLRAAMTFFASLLGSSKGARSFLLGLLGGVWAEQTYHLPDPLAEPRRRRRQQEARRRAVDQLLGAVVDLVDSVGDKHARSNVK